MDTDQVLLEQFVRDHPLEASQVIDKRNEDEIAALLDGFPIDLMMRLFKTMNSYKVAKILKSLNEEIVISLFKEIDLQFAESVLRQCEPEFSNKILDGLTPKVSSLLRNKLEYKQDTVGSFMNPITFGLRKNQRVDDAISLLKKEINGNASIVCVVDENEKLEGLIRLQDLLYTPGQTDIASIMKTNFPRFNPDTNIESLANHSVWHEFQSIPVENADGQLVGILNVININAPNSEKELTKQIIQTSSSLGELYRIGLSGFLQVINR